MQIVFCVAFSSNTNHYTPDPGRRRKRVHYYPCCKWCVTFVVPSVGADFSLSHALVRSECETISTV